MAAPNPALPDDHPDAKVLHEIRDELLARAGGMERLAYEYPVRLLEAVEFVIDPVRTGRQTIAELDKNEKTFIGTKCLSKNEKG